MGFEYGDWLAFLWALVVQHIKEILIGTISALLLIPLRRLWKKWRSMADAETQVQGALAAVNSPRGLWRAREPKFPFDYLLKMQSSIPVLLVANFKGGVGKTTLTANLAASFAAKGERVLTIDLDYQGSLSSMLLPTHLRLPSGGTRSKASQLISGACDGAWLVNSASAVPNVPNVWCVPAFYDLASEENRVMVEWLVGYQTEDIRYHLAKVLLDDHVKANFNRVIIDAPPRFTTATMQAIAASTHVLIPSVVDVLAGEAVGTFVGQLQDHKELAPKLKFVGVVGTMKRHVGVQRQGEDAIIQALRQKGTPTDLLPDNTHVPHSLNIGLAVGRPEGSRVIYADPGQSQAVRTIRENFDLLRDEIIKRG